MKICFALVTIVVLLTSPAVASHGSKTQVKGVVQKVESNSVTLWARGKSVVVQRNDIPSFYKIAIGEKVTAYVDRPPPKQVR